MIPIIVAFPLIMAFLTSILPALRRERFSKHLFLIGMLSPWLILPQIINNLPSNEVVGNWSRVSGIEVAVDAYNIPFIVAELILSAFVALYVWSYYPRKIENKAYVLILLLHSGLLGAFISRDLFNYYIYMEIASVASFALVGISKEKGARRAAFKYTVFSLLASYIFILGIGIIYLKTGYLNLALIKENLRMSREINAALALSFTSLLLKSGIFPLYFWLPDAHSKADAPVSALLSGLVVKAPAYGMILLTLTFPINSFVQKTLLSLAFLSMFFGIGMMLLQKNSERLLAYSTVSQMGYVLLGIALLNPLAAAYYALAHALFKGGLFLSVGSLAEHYETRDLEKLSYRNNKILMLAIVLLSLAIGGVSPFIGAFGKAMLIENLKGFLKYAFYAGGIGTLVSFTKLNYYLSKRGEKIEIPKRKEVISLSLGILTLLGGIYLYPHLSVLKDSISLAIAIFIFYLLRKLGVFEVSLRAFTPEQFKTLGKEINAYMLLFTAVLLLFLFNFL
ncbi:proton-conducting transporter transmembrane domain-containing protein [Thermococcus alcaliphilus]|uniref:proton-conducting transporter transmembrane domain-containing protein n=1 Tax=Thermococcus alcaliphilus TaxID=139207 RepID=UPI002091A722|nr:proton-conducting transporter membrane subunit [Thermococcus alcaliphilus]MCO6041273.1 monovalent cation/H+ antiporter subunit D family protein [Thermococcus alcaliphilus]